MRPLSTTKMFSPVHSASRQPRPSARCARRDFEKCASSHSRFPESSCQFATRSPPPALRDLRAGLETAEASGSSPSVAGRNQRATFDAAPLESQPTGRAPPAGWKNICCAGIERFEAGRPAAADIQRRAEIMNSLLGPWQSKCPPGDCRSAKGWTFHSGRLSNGSSLTPGG